MTIEPNMIWELRHRNTRNVFARMDENKKVVEICSNFAKKLFDGEGFEIEPYEGKSFETKKFIRLDAKDRLTYSEFKIFLDREVNKDAYQWWIVN